jgi:DNA-binding response OmpR family regulator
MNRCNVLIAEDDYFVKKILEDESHLLQNIFFVKDIAEAIKIIREFTIDIAILDLDIPHAEAYEILSYIEMYSKVKTEIVVFSNKSNAYFLKNRNVRIYNKPLNVLEVKNLINTICELINEKK